MSSIDAVTTKIARPTRERPRICSLRGGDTWRFMAGWGGDVVVNTVTRAADEGASVVDVRGLCTSTRSVDDVNIDVGRPQNARAPLFQR